MVYLDSIDFKIYSLHFNINIIYTFIHIYIKLIKQMKNEITIFAINLFTLYFDDMLST